MQLYTKNSISKFFSKTSDSIAGQKRSSVALVDLKKKDPNVIRFHTEQNQMPAMSNDRNHQKTYNSEQISNQE